MKITRFETDRRLWFWIALALFFTCWFIPFFDVKDWHASAFGIWVEVLGDAFRGELSFFWAIGPFFLYACCFAVPSIIFAWVIQCIVVIVKTKI